MSHPAARGASRRSLGRWLVALLATVVLVVAGSGLVAFAQTGGVSKGPAFVPQGSPLYVEARLDMPDGQSEALAQFLTAFPGFADATSFQMKIDEALDSLVSEATDDELTFSQLSAFATGEIGLAITEFDEAAMAAEEPPMIVGVAISDRAAAQSFVDALLEAEGDDLAETPYGSTTILSSDDEDVALAVHDEWILLGTTVDVLEAGIDTLEGSQPSLAGDPEFTTAFGRVPSARLGAAYLDLQALTSLISMAADQSGMQMGGMPIEEILDQLPIDMTAYLAAESDRMTLEAFITPSPATQLVTSGESDLATLFPADTQLFVETRALGQTVQNAMSGMFEMMDEEQSMQMAPFEDMLGTDFETFLDFVDDAAIGGSMDSDGLWLGIAAEVTDEATAATRVERLLGLVRLFGASEDSGVTITESTVGAATVTTISLPPEAMGGGSPIPLGDSIDVAVTGGHLLIGTGDFVENAITGVSPDSLAESPGYVDALADDTINAGVLYANVSALLTSIDPLLSMMMPEWQEIAPYATAIDRIIAVGQADEVISSRMTVIVDS